jgi:hypothetical protein
VRYVKPDPGAWDRLPLASVNRVACCDCGLVHDFYYRIRRVGKGHKLYRKYFVNGWATAAIRRRREHKTVARILRKNGVMAQPPI